MKQKRNPGYYHESERGYSNIVYFEDQPAFSEAVNWHGPFKTFTACKKDAIGYHRCDVQDSQAAIEQLRKLKKKDIEVM